MYKIQVIDTKKSKIPQIKAAKDGILLKAPFSLLVNGKTGSGKSMAILNLISQPWGYKNYFDKIIVFSPTAGICDDLWDGIVSEDNIINNPQPEFIDMIFDSQKKQLKQKKHIHLIDKVLIIFDDCQGVSKHFDKELTKIFVKNRHFNISCVWMGQSYKRSLPRAARLQASGVMLCPASNSETQNFIEEYAPPNMSKKQFQQLIDYCLSDPYNFLFINTQVPFNSRYRKNFDEILFLNKKKSPD